MLGEHSGDARDLELGKAPLKLGAQVLRPLLVGILRIFGHQFGNQRDAPRRHRFADHAHLMDPGDRQDGLFDVVVSEALATVSARTHSSPSAAPSRCPLTVSSMLSIARPAVERRLEWYVSRTPKVRVTPRECAFHSDREHQMSTYKQLRATRDALEAQVAQARTAELAGVLQGICEVMAEYDLTVEDIARAFSSFPRGPRPIQPAAPSTQARPTPCDDSE